MKSKYAGARFDTLEKALASHAPASGAVAPGGDGPCTLLIDEIEAIWSAIAERDDWAPFDAKVEAIRASAAPPGSPVPQ